MLVVALAFAPSSNGEAQQIDQSNVVDISGGFASANVNSWNQLAQTFTAGRSGLLTEVDLQLVAFGDLSTLTNNIIFTISRLSSLNSPVGVPLATVTLHPSDLPHLDQAGYDAKYLLPVHLNSAPFISQGGFFSLTLTSAQPWDSGGYMDWIVTQSVNIDRYPAGNAWENNNATGWYKDAYQVDYGFRTYVTPVPEPSAVNFLALAASFMAGVSLVRRTRCGNAR
ncbi:MAG TPA: hypothetical protein VMB80_00305 [Candidatus Acidoferrum sp.]|nr:hypothetical protein [Candidatus Acidoferrum sp.]